MNNWIITAPFVGLLMINPDIFVDSNSLISSFIPTYYLMVFVAVFILSLQLSKQMIKHYEDADRKANNDLEVGNKRMFAKHIQNLSIAELTEIKDVNVLNGKSASASLPIYVIIMFVFSLIAIVIKLFYGENFSEFYQIFFNSFILHNLLLAIFHTYVMDNCIVKINDGNLKVVFDKESNGNA